MRSRREFLKLGTSGALLGSFSLAFSATNQPVFQWLGNEKAFLQACARGEVETVKKLLQLDPQLLSAKDKVGRSGFALSLLAGHKVVADLLRKAAYLPDLHESALALDWDRFGELIGEESEESVRRVNADHPVGGNAMWAAAAGGAGSDIWRVYAQCGDPNGNPRQKAGTTALQKALRFTELSVAEMTAATLLSNHANPNTAQNADQPPLHIAAARGSYELVEMLIRLGAKVDQKDQKGWRAIQIAEKSGHQEIWKLLQDHQQIARTCRTSRATFQADGNAYHPVVLDDIPLYLRRRFVGKAHGDLEYVKEAIATDPRMVHSVATTSEKAVEACAHTGRKAVVEYLLKHGAPYSLPTAVMLNDHTTVKRLLAEDPNRIHERGAHDFALLWYPIIGRCDLDMTHLLLERGAKVEEQHYLGTTALHWACRRGPIELVEILVENGADVNRVGRKFKAEGQRPLDMVKDDKIADFLRSKGAKYGGR